MRRPYAIAMFFMALCACESESAPVYLLYRAPFDVSQVDEADGLIKALASEWELRVFENSRSEMRGITDGKPAFSVTLFFENDPVLFLSNAGVGEILSLFVMDFGEMPIEELQRLTAQVGRALEDRLSIDFKKSDESTADVDVLN
jgi:hypothetical protein